MDEEKQVANTEVKETPAVEPTPPQTTEKEPTDVGTVAKETPSEPSDRLDKHPRFQELNRKAKDAVRQAEEYRRLYEEATVKKEPPPQADDPYAGMTPDEAKQTREWIDKYVKPEVRKEYEPFIQEIRGERQFSQAKVFASKFGINIDERIPEIVDYLSRPENKGRLTATEAVRNLYFDEITSSVKSNTAEGIQKEKEELIEKKKQANMQTASVSPSAVIASDEAARAKMTRDERLQSDIKEAIAMAKRGERNPRVKVD